MKDFLKYNWDNSKVLYAFLLAGIIGALILFYIGETANGITSIWIIFLFLFINSILDYGNFKKLPKE